MIEQQEPEEPQEPDSDYPIANNEITNSEEDSGYTYRRIPCAHTLVQCMHSGSTSYSRVLHKTLQMILA